MNDMVQSEPRALSEAANVQSYQFINALSGEGIAATLPTIGIVTNEGKRKSELSGTAIFKGDKLSGLPWKYCKKKTKVTPVLTNNKLRMNIEIDTKVAIAENGSQENYITGKGQEILKKAAEKQLKAHVKMVITKVQREYGVDIFGFGSMVKRQQPGLWKANKA